MRPAPRARDVDGRDVHVGPDLDVCRHQHHRPSTSSASSTTVAGESDTDATTTTTSETTSTTSPPPPECGNGAVEAGEECDDGPGNADDAACTSACVAAVCGDGHVWAGMEACDEGPSNADDAACTSACAAATCGDGLVQAGVEACDDGNADDTDTCLSSCVEASCGDGFVGPGEGCDDANMVDDDGCTNACTLPGCGDGIVQMGEVCDDGNKDDTDACTNACTDAVCGDAIVWAGMEACDDGNADNTDACLDTCEAASCGDGFVQVDVEECDDGNADDTDECVQGCKTATCGDAFVQAGVEACDDGNDVDDDACTNACTLPIAHAACTDLVTDMSVWGLTSTGVDLRAWTDSTLHYIGCPGNGCPANTFYCNYDMDTQMLEFGTNSNSAMRAVVDPDNSNGDAMPNSYNGCCKAPLGLCNSPDNKNNGVAIMGGGTNVEALCHALGYQNGQFISSVNNNSCAEPHVLDSEGLQWTSDYVNSSGWGKAYRCDTFK
ncbi:MAG: DUF4215 domain-containing protein [Nannocystaceae bacterium]